MLLKEVKYLFLHELKSENRQRFALNGILLYVASTVYVTYSATRGDAAGSTWTALFWLIMLFAAANAMQRTFVKENTGRFLYFYTLCSPQGIVLAKMAYNSLLTTLVSLLTWLVFSLLMGDQVENKSLFIPALLIGNAGMGALFTFIAALSSKSTQNSTLMAVLGFPVLLPLLLSLVKVSNAAVAGMPTESSTTFLIVLIAMNVLIWALAYVLFPYLWRD